MEISIVLRLFIYGRVVGWLVRANQTMQIPYLCFIMRKWCDGDDDDDDD